MCRSFEWCLKVLAHLSPLNWATAETGYKPVRIRPSPISLGSYGDARLNHNDTFELARALHKNCAFALCHAVVVVVKEVACQRKS